MAVKIKNPSLRAKVFKKMRSLENRALKHYANGRMKEGKKLEKQSDSLYKKNYSKMFEVTRKKVSKKR